MADIDYRTWSLIPRDLDPPGQVPNLTNPPLMPNLALDPGTTLQFDLGQSVAGLTAHVTVTAMSVEGRADGFLQVLTGPAGGLRPVTSEWSRSQDGPNVLLHLRLGAAGPCIKLHLPDGAAIVVCGIAFESAGA